MRTTCTTDPPEGPTLWLAGIFSVRPADPFIGMMLDVKSTLIKLALTRDSHTLPFPLDFRVRGTSLDVADKGLEETASEAAGFQGRRGWLKVDRADCR